MDYKSFYRMHSDPFPPIPEKGVFFESITHLNAIEFVLSCLGGKDVFVLIVGDYGTGKTSLCLKLLESLKENENVQNVIYVPTPSVPYAMILKSVANLRGIDLTSTHSPEQLAQAIYESYENIDLQNKKVVILVDDFQEYNVSLMEQIKWLGGFHTKEGFFPFLFVIFGHPKVIEKINSQVFGSFGQKIRKRYFLDALDPLETKEYIYFRLLNSGAKGFPYFTDEVIAQIHSKSRGIPRHINTICDACLSVGASLGKKVIDIEVLRKALSVFAGPKLEEIKDEEVSRKEEAYKEEVSLPQKEKGKEEPSKPIYVPQREEPLEKGFEVPIPFESDEGKKVKESKGDGWEKIFLRVLKLLIYLAITVIVIGGAIYMGDQLRQRFLSSNWHVQEQRSEGVPLQPTTKPSETMKDLSKQETGKVKEEETPIRKKSEVKIPENSPDIKEGNGTPESLPTHERRSFAPLMEEERVPLGSKPIGEDSGKGGER